MCVCEREFLHVQKIIISHLLTQDLILKRNLVFLNDYSANDCAISFIYPYI